MNTSSPRVLRFPQIKIRKRGVRWLFDRPPTGRHRRLRPRLPRGLFRRGSRENGNASPVPYGRAQYRVIVLVKLCRNVFKPRTTRGYRFRKPNGRIYEPPTGTHKTLISFRGECTQSSRPRIRAEEAGTGWPLSQAARDITVLWNALFILVDLTRALGAIYGHKFQPGAFPRRDF